jgi:hypothetical protein
MEEGDRVGGEDENGQSILQTCIRIEWNLLDLFQEWGGRSGSEREDGFDKGTGYIFIPWKYMEILQWNLFVQLIYAN